MRTVARLILSLAVISTLACGGTSPTSPSSTPITISGNGISTYTFTADVQPILASDCLSCHGPTQQQAGLNFSTYAGLLKAVSAGSDASLLVRVTQPGGLMYNNLSGNRNSKAGIIYDWVVNSKATQ
jgi:hypothetical protein